MNNGEIHALHYETGQPVCLRWQEGVISAVTASPEKPPPDCWLAPGLVDLQINGFAGVDFQQDGLTAAELLRAARGLQRCGCHRFLATLITDEWPRLLARLAHLRRRRDEAPELRAAIAGWHIEGPFLSPQPGFAGAHEAAVMCDPSPERLRELRVVTGSDPVLLTIAPERTGALEAIALAVSLGFKVSLGHTNASAVRLREAVQAGATGFTHLANGCPRELDRHDNILWRVFETAGLTVSLIADGIHVSPAPFRLVHRVMGGERIYYTTDAMAAAGAPPGRYPLGRMEVEVGEDQIVRKPGSPLFAGSALRPIDGVFRAAGMLGCSWRETWKRWSDAPARFMGLPRGWELGAAANFCVVQAGSEATLKSLRVCVRGEWIVAGEG